jgi:hypothetical protein
VQTEKKKTAKNNLTAERDVHIYCQAKVIADLAPILFLKNCPRFDENLAFLNQYYASLF